MKQLYRYILALLANKLLKNDNENEICAFFPLAKAESTLNIKLVVAE